MGIEFTCLHCGDPLVTDYPDDDKTPDSFELDRGICEPYCEFVREDVDL